VDSRGSVILTALNALVNFSQQPRWLIERVLLELETVQLAT